MISSSIIQGYYHTILNRAGSDAEVAGWTNLVADGTLPISQVEVGFINSFETQTSVVPIIEIYQAALGRVPDRASLMAWVSALNSGAATMQQISLSIAGSAESQALYGTTFDANFITTVYENILGREPEGGAVDGWLAAKDAGLNQAMMIDAIATSVEAKMRYAPAVPNFLRSAVQNNPGAYEGSLFRSGLSFALTTNVDSGVAFTGSTGNDTFQAVEITVGSPVPTWTTADAIDGGGGNDTFNVTQTAPIIGAPLNATVANIETANIVDAGAVTLDTTLWTGLMELNVTDSGATSLTADVPTSVGVTDTAGAVSITGGWNQAVMTSAGDVTLAHGSGTLSVDDSALGLHTVNVNGGSSVDIAVTGETTGSGNVINVGSSVAPTGAVTIIASSDPLATTGGTMGSIFVKGGSSINITQNALGAPSGFTTAAGYVGISGTADTKSVTVAQSARVIASVGVRGVGNNSVGISDVNQASNTLAGTITSVTASNFTTLNISDNALTTLAVAGGSGNVLVSNGNLTIPTNLTLNATIDGETGGSFINSNVYTRLNITTANSNSTLANISFAATTTLAIAGTKALRLTSTNGLAALQTVTVSGAAGLTANLSGAQVTAIDTSATTGTSTIFMDGSRATFSGGNGADIVTVSSQASKAIALGGGDDEIIIGSFVPTATISGGLGIDTLSINSTAAATASGNNIFAGWVTGFEQLILTGATNQTIDLAVLGILGGVTTHGGNGMTLSNMSSGSTLTLDGAGTAYTISNAAFTAGVSDVINLALTDGSGAGVAFATTGITAANVETIAITTADTQATPSGTFNDLITLLGNSSSTITVAGNAGLTLNATSTRLTTVNAGGISLGGIQLDLWSIDGSGQHHRQRQRHEHGGLLRGERRRGHVYRRQRH